MLDNDVLLQILAELQKQNNLVFTILTYVGFFSVVILPLCGLVWFLKSIFKPFVSEGKGGL